MYSVPTSNSVVCLLLHLACAKTYSTLPWQACGIDSGSWEGGGGWPSRKRSRCAAEDVPSDV